jgi:thioesterase domain-containing protein
MNARLASNEPARQAPTLTDLGFGAADASEALVSLRSQGDGAPLFCFPGSGGRVTGFRELVGALPVGFPVYGVNLEWLCDVETEFTVEQVAELCLPIVERHAATGPYHFCGFSFGGLLAYEMAARSSEIGRAVGLVALLDAPNPQIIANLSPDAAKQFRKTYWRDRWSKYFHDLVRGNFRAFVARGFAFAVSRSGRFALPWIKRLYRLVRQPMPAILRANDPSFIRAWHAYVPKPCANRLTLFRVDQRGPEHDRDPSMGWARFALGGVEVHTTAAGHVAMLAQPSVRAIADAIAPQLTPRE